MVAKKILFVGLIPLLLQCSPRSSEAELAQKRGCGYKVCQKPKLQIPRGPGSSFVRSFRGNPLKLKEFIDHLGTQTKRWQEYFKDRPPMQRLESIRETLKKQQLFFAGGMDLGSPGIPTQEGLSKATSTAVFFDEEGELAVLPTRNLGAFRIEGGDFVVGLNVTRLGTLQADDPELLEIIGSLEKKLPHGQGVALTAGGQVRFIYDLTNKKIELKEIGPVLAHDFGDSVLSLQANLLGEDPQIKGVYIFKGSEKDSALTSGLKIIDLPTLRSFFKCE